jgi:hypothetical protein
MSAEFTFTTTEQADVDDAVQSDEDEAELRLFAAPANAAPATLKVRLSSPGPDKGDGSGFLVKKPHSYYFADEPTSDEELALQASAVDGRTVLEMARQPWPACAMPWKVTTITKDGIKKQVLVGHPPMLATVDETQYKRTRKGKKARIALRQSSPSRRRGRGLLPRRRQPSARRGREETERRRSRKRQRRRPRRPTVEKKRMPLRAQHKQPRSTQTQIQACRIESYTYSISKARFRGDSTHLHCLLRAKESRR